MAFFYYQAQIPDDVFTPKEHSQEELDSLLIPMDRRDGCGDHYAEFKKCIQVQHQTQPLRKWKRRDQDYCGYYFDHWNYCREKRTTELGLISTMNTL